MIPLYRLYASGALYECRRRKRARFASLWRKLFNTFGGRK